VCELARRVTGESGKELVRAIRQFELPVLGEHGGGRMRVETASEMTSFRRVRLGTGTITRTRGQMTDYMDRYMGTTLEGMGGQRGGWNSHAITLDFI
jgi:hypothetical protein